MFTCIGIALARDSSKLMVPLVLTSVLLSACVPGGKWLPVLDSDTAGGSRIEGKDTVVIDSLTCCIISIRGRWSGAYGSHFSLGLENQADSPLKIDLHKTLFTYEKSAAVKQDHSLGYVARPKNTQDRESITILGPASSHAGRILGEGRPSISFEDLLTVEGGQTIDFELAFKVLPRRGGESHGILRVVLDTEAKSQVAEVRFRAKR